MGGTLIIAGGNLEQSEQEIHRHLIAHAGGTGAKLAIVPTASGAEPYNSIEHVAQLWQKLGVPADNIVKLPLYGEEGTRWQQPSQGDSTDIVDMLGGVTGIWFTGGDQYYIHKALLRKDGTDTTALQRMREIYATGGVIGGTSAGAAMMSAVMIASGNNISALQLPAVYGYDDYDDDNDEQPHVRIVRGLGFFTDGVIDQHFDRRARMLRLIKAVTDAKHPLTFGYGVSEDTAMVYDRDRGDISIVGSGALYIVDCSKMEKATDGSMTFANVTLHVAKAGDCFRQHDNTLTFKD